MQPKVQDDVIARITITGPGLMNDEERQIVARWLRGHATALVKDGELYTDTRFTGRLHGPLSAYKPKDI